MHLNCCDQLLTKTACCQRTAYCQLLCPFLSPLPSSRLPVPPTGIFSPVTGIPAIPIAWPGPVSVPPVIIIAIPEPLPFNPDESVSGGHRSCIQRNIKPCGNGKPSGTGTSCQKREHQPKGKHCQNLFHSIYFNTCVSLIRK